MEAKEAQQYQSWCNDNGTRIYPVPLYDKSTSYKICVERNLTASIGKLVFEDNPKGKEPSVWHQIRELYKIIYKRDNILPLMDYSYLPIEHQIELTQSAIKLSEEHIKHYSSNPIQLDELRFKIQTQSLSEHNKELHERLKKLEKKSKINQ